MVATGDPRSVQHGAGSDSKKSVSSGNSKTTKEDIYGIDRYRCGPKTT